MIPTRWVKFVIAIFLLPLCAVLTQTFFTVFARATVTQRLWAGEEFWFFSLGAILWLIAFFGLPRPMLIYVFGHELTHALWVLLMGGRVSRFRVGRDGGHIVTDRNNFWIALAPYFFPLYSIIVIGALRGAQSVFQRAAVRPASLRPDRRDLGVSLYFHLLDDPEETDGPDRPRHFLFPRGDLPDEPAAAERHARSGVVADTFAGFRARLLANTANLRIG